MDNLPGEIILNIADNIERENDLNHFLQTAPRYAQLLTHNLYARDLTHYRVDGLPILHWATAKGHVSVVKRLLEYGFDPRLNNNGITALSMAAQGGKRDIVEILLDAGAGVDVTYQKKSLLTMPLVIACRQGNHDVIDLLIDRGADVSGSYNTMAETALHGAVLGWGEKEHTVRTLLDAGADTSAKDWRGKTPLHLAAENGEELLVKMILQAGADVNVRSNDGKTALVYATINQKVESVRLLSAAGADSLSPDRAGYSAYGAAICNGYYEILKIFIDSGASPSNGMLTHVPAVFIANLIKDGRMLDLFLRAAADNSARDTFGRTVLFPAIENDCPIEGVGGPADFVQLLLDAGASVSVRDNIGGTPLHHAVLHDKETVVRMLIDRGADILAQYANGITVLDCALSGGRENIAQLLKRLGAEDSRG